MADTGFFLNGNTVRRGSNIIIYGNNAQVTHTGGGVANGGGVGSPQGGGGGGGGVGGGGGNAGSGGKTGKVTTGGSGAGGGGGKGGVAVKTKSAGGVRRLRAGLRRVIWLAVRGRDFPL